MIAKYGVLTLYNTEQGIYQSLVNENHDIFCMHFDIDNPKYPRDLIESSFQREIRYLKRLSKYHWSPEVIDVDNKKYKIFFKWYDNDCRNTITPNYKDQLLEIAEDLHKEEIYKPSFYPKYFYIDNKNNMHCFSFYTASDYKEQPIDMEFYKPILNPDRLSLVEKICVDGKLNISVLMKYAFKEYIHWPENPLPEIYKKIYE